MKPSFYPTGRLTTCLILLGALVIAPGTAFSWGRGAPDDNREESVARFEELLDRYPESEMRAPVLVLLGNLYVEIEKERYLSEVIRFEDGVSDEKPVLDYSAATEAFIEIIDNHPNYPGRAEALYALGICREEMGLKEQAIARFESSVACGGEDNPIRPLAMVRIADLHFYAGNWKRALDGYEKALRWGIDAESHKIEYKTGWCHLKRDNLTEAGRLFQICADRAWAAGRGAKGREDLTEVLRSLALVQVDSAPSDVKGYAARFDNPGLERAALVEFGEVLLDQDRPADAERAYRAALVLDGESEDAPLIHDRIIETLTIRDEKEPAGREMEDFYAKFGPSGEWWKSIRKDPDRVEDLMSRLRRNVWNAALVRYRSGGESDLPVAATLFEAYVDELGGSTGRDRARLFAAEAWYRSGKYGSSRRNFALIDLANLEEPAEKMAALRGAVLAEKDGGGAVEDFAGAAIRYAEHFPGEEDAQKALLLAAEKFEEEGNLAGALELSERVAARESSPVAGEASLRAGRIHSSMNNHSAAEAWFLKSSEKTENGADRLSRLEKAAASSFLAAQVLEEDSDWRGAAEAYARTGEEYGGTTLGLDAIRRQIICAGHLEDGAGAVAMADSLVERTPGDTLSAGVIRESALLFSQAGSHRTAGDLLVRSSTLISSPGDLYNAAGEYKKDGAGEEALRHYEELASRYSRSEEAPRAAYRIALLLVEEGRFAEGASWFDRSLRYPEPTDRETAEVRFREGEAYRGAGETEKAAGSYELAIEAGGDGSLEGTDESGSSWYVARAHFVRAEQIRPHLEKNVATWRKGKGRDKPAKLFAEYIGHLRSGIAFRFEEITDPEIEKLATALELYARTAHMREWDRGNEPAADLVEPYYSDAAALMATSGTAGEGNGIYAALADTLVHSADRDLNDHKPPSGDDRSSDGWFDRHSNALVERLGALDRAEAKWRTAAEFLARQHAVDPGRIQTLSRSNLSLAVRAAEENQRGAELLAASPSPPGMNEEDDLLYRSLLEEKAGLYTKRSVQWMEEIEESTAAGIGPSLSQRDVTGDHRDGGR